MLIISNILSLKKFGTPLLWCKPNGGKSFTGTCCEYSKTNSKFRERMQNLYFRLLTVIYKLPPEKLFWLLFVIHVR